MKSTKDLTIVGLTNLSKLLGKQQSDDILDNLKIKVDEYEWEYANDIPVQSPYDIIFDPQF